MIDSVGVIGLGATAGALPRRLLGPGSEVTVCACDLWKVAELAAESARAARIPADAADAADAAEPADVAFVHVPEGEHRRGALRPRRGRWDLRDGGLVVRAGPVGSIAATRLILMALAGLRSVAPGRPTGGRAPASRLVPADGR